LEPVVIDGSRGEGGGQILRTSLALSILTGRPLHMHRIRAGRKKPDLQRQHIVCVQAAAQLCGGYSSKLEVGTSELEFTPGDTWPTQMRLDIGTAGSTTLVIQTILVPVLATGRALRAVIIGGTHNPMAPPFEFLDRVFVPHLRKMGGNVTLLLEKRGLMPNGGGRIVLDIAPSKLVPLDVIDAGRVIARKATAIVAKIPRHVGEREVAVAQERLDSPVVDVIELPNDGPHNVFMAEVELESGARDLVTNHGRRGYPAEDVATDALDELEKFIDAGVPVGECLADQLLLPMAVARGGKFRTIAPLSLHTHTNIETIQHFLDVSIRVEESGTVADVTIGAS
jgi:RNA 3'-terminal phosphate cyclase (ATP)